MDQRKRELDAVNRLTREVTASLAPDQVISAAYKQVISIVEPDLMVIYLRVGDKLICQGKKLRNTQLMTGTNEVKTIGECLCGKVAAEKIPIYASDIQSDPRCMLKGGKAAGFRGITRNIMERKLIEIKLKESEKKYRELSMIDDLTQLFNSRHFYNQLKIEINRVNRYEAPVTLILLDVDDFKDFNDAHGHVEGDRVLTRLGRVIKRCLRKTDSAYRYGGEEFIVLMPETKSEDGILVAERIRAEFKKETFSPSPGKNVHITLSLGICHYKQNEDMKAFVHRVDQLMYQAKKNGKDRVCHASA